jgi:hypothetical protein
MIAVSNVCSRSFSTFSLTSPPAAAACGYSCLPACHAELRSVHTGRHCTGAPLRIEHCVRRILSAVLHHLAIAYSTNSTRIENKAPRFPAALFKRVNLVGLRSKARRAFVPFGERKIKKLSLILQPNHDRQLPLLHCATSALCSHRRCDVDQP